MPSSFSHHFAVLVEVDSAESVDGTKLIHKLLRIHLLGHDCTCDEWRLAGGLIEQLHSEIAKDAFNVPPLVRIALRRNQELQDYACQRDLLWSMVFFRSARVKLCAGPVEVPAPR